MYKIPKYRKSLISRPENCVEGERIEHKVERLISNKEPIKDGAPLIFTEAKDGVQSAYNIRTDRWEIATEAMDLVHKSKTAKRDGLPKKDKKEDVKTIEMKGDGKAESTPGKANGIS
jgi:hypothetical protein